MKTQINKLDFTGQNIYSGIDVHAKSWKVTIMTDTLTIKTFSQSPSPEILYHYLVTNFPGGTYYSAYEAGFCGYWIHNRLKALGINSIVVNAADIPTSNKEQVSKTDARDSKKIARSLRSGDLIPIYVPTIKNLEDRTLVRMRYTLVKELTRNKNRIKSFLHFHGIEIPEIFEKSQWSGKFIQWLKEIEMKESSSKITLSLLVTIVIEIRKMLLELTKQIIVLSRTVLYLKRVILLRSIPGIGLITSMLILTELENILRFSTLDKLCSFIGLVPSTHASGESDPTGKITKRAHSKLRTALVESAWTAVRFDPALTLSFNKLCARMDSNKVIIRIAKKLLSRILFVLKNNQTYVFSIVK